MLLILKSSIIGWALSLACDAKHDDDNPTGSILELAFRLFSSQEESLDEAGLRGWCAALLAVGRAAATEIAASLEALIGGTHAKQLEARRGLTQLLQEGLARKVEALASGILKRAKAADGKLDWPTFRTCAALQEPQLGALVGWLGHWWSRRLLRLQSAGAAATTSRNEAKALELSGRSVDEIAALLREQGSGGGGGAVSVAQLQAVGGRLRMRASVHVERLHALLCDEGAEAEAEPEADSGLVLGALSLLAADAPAALDRTVALMAIDTGAAGGCGGGGDDAAEAVARALTPLGKVALELLHFEVVHAAELFGVDARQLPPLLRLAAERLAKYVDGMALKAAKALARGRGVGRGSGSSSAAVSLPAERIVAELQAAGRVREWVEALSLRWLHAVADLDQQYELQGEPPRIRSAREAEAQAAQAAERVRSMAAEKAEQEAAAAVAKAAAEQEKARKELERAAKEQERAENLRLEKEKQRAEAEAAVLAQAARAKAEEEAAAAAAKAAAEEEKARKREERRQEQERLAAEKAAKDAEQLEAYSTASLLSSEERSEKLMAGKRECRLPDVSPNVSCTALHCPVPSPQRVLGLTSSPLPCSSAA